MSCSASCVRCRLPYITDEPKSDASVSVVRQRYTTPPPDVTDLFAARPKPPRQTAVHEAAHAVTWIALGGELAASGVDVLRYHACSRFITAAQDRYAADLMTTLAGPLAEHLLHGCGFGWFSSGLWSFALSGARLGHEQGRCDECYLARRILQRRRERGQRSTDKDIAREWDHYRDRTVGLHRPPRYLGHHQRCRRYPDRA